MRYINDLHRHTVLIILEAAFTFQNGILFLAVLFVFWGNLFHFCISFPLLVPLLSNASPKGFYIDHCFFMPETLFFDLLLELTENQGLNKLSCIYISHRQFCFTLRIFFVKLIPLDVWGYNFDIFCCLFLLCIFCLLENPRLLAVSVCWF